MWEAGHQSPGTCGKVGGSVIYSAIRHWGNWGNAFWVLEPIGLLLLTGFAFTMLGFALEKILNPRLKDT